jgi:hypothetical protein
VLEIDFSMDQIKEGEDPSCWTPDSLRKCQSLTLASDVALLKCMQNLSLVGLNTDVVHFTLFTFVILPSRGWSPVPTAC